MKNRVDYAKVSAAIRAGKSNADIRREIDGRLRDKTLNEIRVRMGAVEDMSTRDIAEAIIGGAEETTEETTKEDEDMRDETIGERANAAAEAEGSETREAAEMVIGCGVKEPGVPEITGKSVYVVMDARGENHHYTLDGESCLTVFDADKTPMFSVPMGELKEIMREALWLEAEIEKELARHE